jgi:glutathione S-transferase
MSNIFTQYPLTSFATAASSLLLFGLGIVTGVSRSKYGVKPPATTGHIEYEKRNRAHYNTIESALVTLPSAWLVAGFSGNDLLAGGLTLTWVIGRILFAIGYIKAPEKREVGGIVSILSSLPLLLGAAYYTGKAVFSKYF